MIVRKAQIERLWRALCASTYKPGCRAPYDSVCVHDRVIYATDGYVLQRVVGLYQTCTSFRVLHGREVVYLDRVECLERILSHDLDSRLGAAFAFPYDPVILARALRAHSAFGCDARFFTGAVDSAPLIIESVVRTPSASPIIITTAVQGKSR